jgi:hypothetical protein
MKGTTVFTALTREKKLSEMYTYLLNTKTDFLESQYRYRSTKDEFMELLREAIKKDREFIQNNIHIWVDDLKKEIG